MLCPHLFSVVSTLNIDTTKRITLIRTINFPSDGSQNPFLIRFMIIQQWNDRELYLIPSKILDISCNSRKFLGIELECVPTKDTPTLNLVFGN